MSERLTRKEIQHADPIGESLRNAWAYIQENRRLVYGVVGAAVCVGVIWVSAGMITDHFSSARSYTLSKAMVPYFGRVDATLKSATAEAYPTEKARDEASVKALAQAEQELGSSADGLRATYFKAMSLRNLGRYDEAVQGFRKVAEDADAKTGAFARMALAETLRGQKKYDEANKLYDELLASSSLPFTAEAVKSAKAQNLEDAGKFQEAYKLLKETMDQLKKPSNSPEQSFSPYSAEMEQRMETLRIRLAAQGIKVS